MKTVQHSIHFVCKIKETLPVAWPSNWTTASFFQNAKYLDLRHGVFNQITVFNHGELIALAFVDGYLMDVLQ